MNIELLRYYLLDQWAHTSIWEVIGVFFGVLQVLLAYRNHVALYPAGLISTGIFTWLFLRPQTGLYADAALNSYYFVMSVYGWWLWRKGKDKGSDKGEGLAITACSNKDWSVAVTIALGAFVLLFIVLDNFTDSTVPVMDALVSAFAWSGMWLLAQKKLENWLLLNISNAIAIPLLFYKHMPLTALLTVFLFIVAVFGYFRWRRILRGRKPAIAPES